MNERESREASAVPVLKGQANPGDEGAMVDGAGEEDILPSLTASSSPASVLFRHRHEAADVVGSAPVSGLPRGLG